MELWTPLPPFYYSSLCLLTYSNVKNNSPSSFDVWISVQYIWLISNHLSSCLKRYGGKARRCWGGRRTADRCTRLFQTSWWNPSIRMLELPTKIFSLISHSTRQHHVQEDCVVKSKRVNRTRWASTSHRPEFEEAGFNVMIIMWALCVTGGVRTDTEDGGSQS